MENSNKISWTKQQAHVIDSRTGNLLVAAAAGSGKTAVLVERIIEMVMGTDSNGSKLAESDRINVDELLVVTFTNAAAAQMKEKISNALQKKIDEYMAQGVYDEHLIKQMTLINHAEICTIDSFCLRIVREFFAKVQLDSAFDVGDNTQMEIIKKDVMDSVMEQCYQDDNLVPGFIRLVRTFAVKDRDEEVPNLVRYVANVISSYPDGHAWIRDARDAVRISVSDEASEEDKCKAIMNLPMVRLFAERACSTVRMALDMARECQPHCTEDNGLASVGERIDKDVEMLAHMERICEKDDYVNLFALKKVYRDSVKPGNGKGAEGADGNKQHYAFEAIPRTGGNTDQEKKKFVKDRRDVYKELITDLMAVITDVESALGEIRFTAPMLESLLDLTELYMTELLNTKLEKNLFEFHDIEEFAYRILCDGIKDGRPVPSQVGREVSGRYREIFIDEYQDSNYIQEYILGSVAGHESEDGSRINNTFMVGDVKQSIYKFRMARPDLFIGKYDTYRRLTDDQKASGEEPGNCIVLTRNFRSEINVLRTVNGIFEQLMKKEIGGIVYDEAARLNSKYAVEDSQGHMSEPSDVEQGPKAELIMIDGSSVADDLEEDSSLSQIEIRYIAEKIHEIVDGPNPVYINDGDSQHRRKAEYKDIVILLRSVSSAGVVYDQVFEDAGIPIYIQSESGYFGAVEVSCLVSMLSVIDNSYVDGDLAAVLRSPMVGLDEEELARIVGEYRVRYESDHRDYYIRLYDKLIDYAEIHQGENSVIMQKIKTFLDMLDYLKENKCYMSIGDIIRYVLDKTGFYWFVGARPMGRRRQANIDMLIKKAEDFEQNSKGVFNFIRYVNQLKTNSLDFAEADMVSDNDNVVRVMTMHKSKGLEFPILFVAGLGKRFNTKDTEKKVLVHQKYFLSAMAIDPVARVKKNTFLRNVMASEMTTENYAEELRVLYVALTRAKEKLYMTGCPRNLDKFKEKCDVYSIGNEMSSAAVMSMNSFLGWIYTALKFIDYSEFLEVAEIRTSDFAGTGSNPDCELSESHASDIKDADAQHIDSTAEDKGLQSDIDMDIYSHIKQGIEFRYGHISSGLKSKMSITEIKKMQAYDPSQESEDYSDLDRKRIYVEKDAAPVPEFMCSERVVAGNELGTVYHKIMELIDFKLTTDEEILADVDRIFDLGIFDDIYRKRVQPTRIVSMVKGSLGQRMAEADRHGLLRREQQFYMMMKPEEILMHSDKDLSKTDETIVVQGIIDAYFIEDGQIVLMDYKTDSVKNKEDLVKKYHVQLDKYADVLERLTGMKVKEKIIYSFCLDTTVNL